MRDPLGRTSSPPAPGIGLGVRWTKLWRDVSAERGRVASMVVAIAVSLAAVGAVLGAYSVLTREVTRSYLETRPAAATLELPGGVSPDLVERVRAMPGIAEAEARDALLARVKVGRDWRPLLLFVIDDFDRMRLNTFRPESGAWPPPEGTMLIERAAARMLEAAPGDAPVVVTPHGRPQRLRISGTVHDPGLAPAWQERMGYAYVTRATIAALGEPPALNELRIGVRDGQGDRAAIERTARAVAGRLAAEGRRAREIRVPRPLTHPHQLQMTTVLVMLLVFAVMSLALSATLVATTLSAMLARQVREIGVMKTIGARAGQIAGLYVALVAAMGVAALVLAAPVALGGAHLLAGTVARLLNFELASVAIPAWALAVPAVAGLLVPLAVAAVPIRRASRATIRETIDQHGVGAGTLRPAFSRLPAPLRNALRRPRRLALTMVLLASGGAMFMTALNLRASWLASISAFYETRSYDLEVRLRRPEPRALVEAIARVPGVRRVESWGYAPTSVGRSGQLDVSSAYPDGRHATFAIFAPPARTELVRFPVLAGRWLRPSDTDAVVLNHAARAQVPGASVGDRITLSLDGAPTRWRIVGVVQEIGYTPVAYVTDEAFARVAGTGGRARMLRLATSARSDGERARVLRAVEDALAAGNAAVEQGIPLAEHRTAVGEHITVLVRSLAAMAIVMAIVGALGLATTMGVSVVERTREIGVMKTLGATPGRVTRDLMLEALSVAALSWALALVLSLPLTAYLDRLIGGLGFLASLPFVVVPGAAAGWLGAIAVVSVLATWLPARRAASVSVREAIAFT